MYTLDIPDVPLSRIPLVVRMLRAVKQTRPSVRLLAPPWCLGSVLSVLSKAPFEHMVTCDLKLLTWKTAFPFAFPIRVSELHALSCDAPLTIVHVHLATLVIIIIIQFIYKA